MIFCVSSGIGFNVMDFCVFQQLHSEYRSTYTWHEYTGPHQDNTVVRRAPQAPPSKSNSDLSAITALIANIDKAKRCEAEIKSIRDISLSLPKKFRTEKPDQSYVETTCF